LDYFGNGGSQDYVEPPITFVDALVNRKHSLDQTSSESVIAEVSKLSLDVVSDFSKVNLQKSTENDLDRTLPLTHNQQKEILTTFQKLREVIIIPSFDPTQM
jgi:hypothetical protein